MVGACWARSCWSGVLWVFARLQIGASRAGALQSGMAAIPVFLLWAFSSWLVILIGAQVAVAHELDGILIHGARAWQLEPYDEQVAGVQIMVGGGAARAARGRPRRGDQRAGAPVEIATRERAAKWLGGWQRGGLLAESTGGDYRLACDPDRTSVRDVVGAVIGRPAARAGAARAARCAPTLDAEACGSPDGGDERAATRLSE